MITTNRILVVDDNSTLNDLIAKYFEKYGFLLDQACTFLDAKNLLGKESYDLITLDWELDDGKTGIDLLPFVDDSAKVLLVSGRPTHELHDAVQKHEKIDDYLPKMFKEPLKNKSKTKIKQ